MEKHPCFGAQLLLDIPGVESTNPLLPVVAYQHHMGIDQSGYPRVQGRFPQYTLHFASSLIAVADVYDALRTVRPYRPAMTVAKASTILIRDAVSGKLHKEYVSSFLLLLNVLAAGRRVVLSDGSRGIIVRHIPGPIMSYGRRREWTGQRSFRSFGPYDLGGGGKTQPELYFIDSMGVPLYKSVSQRRSSQQCQF